MNPRHKTYFERDTMPEFERLTHRHRLDLAKLLFEKDGGYTLREFKEIYLKEIKEWPEKYTLDDNDSKSVYEYTYGYKDPQDWEKNPLNYDLIIKNDKLTLDNMEKALKEGKLVMKDAKLTVTQRLIKKAADSGLLENEMKKQIPAMKDDFERLSKMLLIAKAHSLNENVQELAQKTLHGEEKKSKAQEYADTYEKHGMIGIKKLLMVRFLE